MQFDVRRRGNVKKGGNENKSGTPARQRAHARPISNAYITSRTEISWFLILPCAPNSDGTETRFGTYEKRNFDRVEKPRQLRRRGVRRRSGMSAQDEPARMPARTVEDFRRIKQTHVAPRAVWSYVCRSQQRTPVRTLRRIKRVRLSFPEQKQKRFPPLSPLPPTLRTV